ncbi:hypothetical protein [Psychroserpens algicola]|uniref:hypothetical protein n=1 Tax=Psychroserpens algicola TaxID=1719034 RepID=UPI001954BE27|nr:hypothetical protein [Psychroserpens algicola]
MKVFILPFGKIKILNPHIAEVIINEGVVMNSEDVDAYHDFLLSNLEAPFSLLVNKENSYTYTFDAQIKIAGLEEIQCMAVVLYNYNAEMATKILIDLNKGNNWNIKLFKDRDEALNWLVRMRKNRAII